MSNIIGRYARLCGSFVSLADRFQTLDVEHMTLKSKLIPLLRVLKHFKATVEQLKQEKAELEATLQALSAKYEALQCLEPLLQPDAQATLAQAEEQMLLVETTLREAAEDSDPDLSEADKVLLHEFHDRPYEFELLLTDMAQPASALFERNQRAA